MKIDQIRLKNFKLFQEKTLNLSSITLLTGINSSGKSTVLNAIAAMLQTPPPHLFPFEIALNGANCSLGTFKDVSTNKKTKKNFGIGFSISDGEEVISLDAIYRYSPRGEHILPYLITCCVGEDLFNLFWTGSSKGYHCNLDLPSLEKLFNDSSYRTFVNTISKLIEEKDTNSKTKLAEEMLSGVSSKDFWLKSNRLSIQYLIEKISSESAGSHIINKIREFSNKLRNYVSYIGPIRAMPLRFYTPDLPHYSIDPKGTYCAQILNDWRKHHKEKFHLVAKLLSELELIDIIKTRSSADDILKVIVKPPHTREESNFIDVGFGVSQALPFIIRDVALPKHGVLCINQPEVHLHPTSQARLADYFVSRSAERQFIVETHSEYLINRFRVLVLKKQIDKEKIRILFFNSSKENNQPSVDSISINPDGSLENAPPEFFNTYYLDSFELAMGGESDD
jgi:hypothetical protein